MSRRREYRLQHEAACQRLQRLELLLGWVRAEDADHARALARLAPDDLEEWELRRQALEEIELALVNYRPVVNRDVERSAREAAGWWKE